METALQIIGGLILLAIGGELVVRGAVGVARRFGMSELLIGLTLVGFGTSTPELLTSVEAAWLGSPGIAIGNVVGSNIGNIILILAIVVLVKPIAVDPNAIKRDGLVMMVASTLLVGFAVLVGELNRIVGIVFLLGLVAYLVTAYRMETTGGAAAQMHEGEVEEHDPGKETSLFMALLFALGGLALLVFGADFLVKGAITLAKMVGLSETVIGLTIVAIGTSLPELVASLVAALKGRSDVAVGNIIGSNIYNILGILGVTATIIPVTVPADMGWVDWGVMYGAAALLLLRAWMAKRIGRLDGAVFLAIYVAFCYYLITTGAAPTA